VLRGAGAELAVLLQGSAVSYAVSAQDASGISFGSWQQTRPPSIPTSVSALVRDGVVVYGIEEDFADRGIREDRCIGGVRRIPRAQVAALFGGFDQIWQW
jgi:hypothetical protein